MGRYRGSFKVPPAQWVLVLLIGVSYDRPVISGEAAMAPLPIHLLWACGSPSSSLGASYVHAGSTMAGYVTCRYSGGYAPTYVPLPTFRYYPGLWSSVSGSPLSVEERTVPALWRKDYLCPSRDTSHTHVMCVCECRP